MIPNSALSPGAINQGRKIYADAPALHEFCNTLNRSARGPSRRRMPPVVRQGDTPVDMVQAAEKPHRASGISGRARHAHGAP